MAGSAVPLLRRVAGAWTRADGRVPGARRQQRCGLGGLSTADGAARWTQGGTTSSSSSSSSSSGDAAAEAEEDQARRARALLRRAAGDTGCVVLAAASGPVALRGGRAVAQAAARPDLGVLELTVVLPSTGVMLSSSSAPASASGAAAGEDGAGDAGGGGGGEGTVHEEDGGEESLLPSGALVVPGASGFDDEGRRVRARLLERVAVSVLRDVTLLSLNPRTLVTVSAHVLHDDGSLLACVVNAAVMALLDASVPMAGLVAAVTVALVESREDEAAGGTTGKLLVIDPTAEEERSAEALLTFIFSSGDGGGDDDDDEEVEEEDAAASPTRGGCVACECTGEFSPEEFFAARAAARPAADEVMAFMRRSVEAKYAPERRANLV